MKLGKSLANKGMQNFLSEHKQKPCIICVAIPFVLVTIAPRFITGAEVNLFFLLETILGPIWVWLVIKEQPSLETILGGSVIILTIGIHSFLALKKT